MTAFVHHFSFEFRRGLRDRNLLLMNYLFPLGFFALMGVLMTQVNPGFKETMVPAMVIFALLSSAVLALPGPLVAAREEGIYRSYRINGVPTISILVIPAVTTIFHMVLVAAVIVIAGPLLFGARMPVNGLGFGLTFVAIAVACTGLGVLIGVIASDSRAIVLWSQLIFLPSMILGGLMLPVSMLPATMSRIAWLLPSTQAMNAFNSLGLGLPATRPPLQSIAILFAGGLLAFALAIYLFKWDNRSDTHRGNPALALLALLPYVAGMILFAV
jgi:ABC-2 type transport system permease protein